jgi:epoxide hydrolase-like predicted phosphatase
VSARGPARAVVSDFGGVLTHPLFEAFAAWQKHADVRPETLGLALQAAAEERGDHPLYELERGELTEDEFVAIVEEQLDGVTLSGFRDVYFEALRPNEPMIDFMRELRGRGLRMAMLTNNVREWEPLWRAKLPVDEIFELVIDSAFVGMRKPDPAIYRLTLERLGGGIEAADCVFLDDLDVNCHAAAELGMRAVQSRDPEQAIAEIEEALRA